MRYNFLFLFFLALTSSCIQESFVQLESSELELGYEQMSLKNNPYFVDMSDVDKYVDFRVLESQSNGTSIGLEEVAPIYSESGAVVMYVIKYDVGWDVISADKRSPMVLASSDTGEFEFSELGSHKFYFDMIAEELNLFSSHEDQRLILTKSLSAESYENVEFWGAISASDEFIQQHLSDIEMRFDSTGIRPMGYWKLIDVESERETYEEIDHLIPLEWGQWDPYNTYCPYNSQNSSLKAPVGCVAVAGAQTLTYLRNFYGLEMEVPSTASVNGNLVQFSNYGTNLWNDIYYNPLSAAVLMSYIGYLVSIQYGDSVSLAATADLKTEVFQRFGIDCSYLVYDADIVKSNLMSGLPVIISARNISSQIGHCFIIDGYSSYRTKYTYTYEWVYDTPSSVPIPTYPNKVEIEYTSPVLEKIKMNWGEGNNNINNSINNNNDTWYTPTGDWTYVIDEYSSVTYNYNKKMMCNFSVIE